MGEPLDSERDRYASPADRNDETGPRRLERQVRSDGAEKKRRRHEKLERRRQEPHRPGRGHAPKRVGETDCRGDGGSLRLHADRAVGNDLSLTAPDLTAPVEKPQNFRNDLRSISFRFFWL